MEKKSQLMIAIILIVSLAVVLSGQVFAINIQKQAKVGEKTEITYKPEVNHPYETNVLVTGPNEELLIRESHFYSTPTTKTWTFIPEKKGTYTAKITSMMPNGEILEQKVQKIEVGA